MDRVEFHLEDGGVAIAVNGSRLEDLARAVEMPYALAENAEHLAGSYAPLALTDIDSDPTHFIGHPM